MQSPGLNSVSSAQIQTPTHQQASQHPLISTTPKDAGKSNIPTSIVQYHLLFNFLYKIFKKNADVGHSKGDEQQQQQQQQQQQNLSDDLNVESTTSSSLNNIISDEDLKSPYTVKTYF